jgi:hypothetical protein
MKAQSRTSFAVLLVSLGVSVFAITQVLGASVSPAASSGLSCPNGPCINPNTCDQNCKNWGYEGGDCWPYPTWQCCKCF